MVMAAAFNHFSGVNDSGKQERTENEKL